jgi:hypothetical protein
MEPSEIMKKLFFIRRKRLNANHFVHRSEDSVLIGSDGKMNSNVVAPAADSGFGQKCRWSGTNGQRAYFSAVRPDPLFNDPASHSRKGGAIIN